jgi:hypothetical protein
MNNERTQTSASEWKCGAQFLAHVEADAANSNGSKKVSGIIAELAGSIARYRAGKLQELD